MLFGISSAPEVYEKNALQMGLEGMVKKTNDVLVGGKTQTEHDYRLMLLLQRFHEFRITLNWSKWKIPGKEVTLLGHLIKNGYIGTDPEDH